MLDYLIALYYLPLYTYELLVGVWGFIESSIPTWNQIIGSFWIFLILWYPRKILEKQWLNKPYQKRRKTTKPPSTSDHHAAASSVGGMFTHH